MCAKRASGRGCLWGKNHDFVGVEEFGQGRRRPRTLLAAGKNYEYNDVRVDRFALSLFGSSGDRSLARRPANRGHEPDRRFQDLEMGAL